MENRLQTLLLMAALGRDWLWRCILACFLRPNEVETVGYFTDF